MDKNGNDVKVMHMGTPPSEAKTEAENEEYMNYIEDMVENKMFQGFSEHFKDMKFDKTEVLIPSESDFEAFLQKEKHLSSTKKKKCAKPDHIESFGGIDENKLQFLNQKISQFSEDGDRLSRKELFTLVGHSHPWWGEKKFMEFMNVFFMEYGAYDSLTLEQTLQILLNISEENPEKIDLQLRHLCYIPTGQKVQLKNLTSTIGKSLNGCIGVIMGIKEGPANGGPIRYMVQVENIEVLKNIKDSNLEVCSPF